jgi:hypothetical protein
VAAQLCQPSSSERSSSFLTFNNIHFIPFHSIEVLFSSAS